MNFVLFVYKIIANYIKGFVVFIEWLQKYLIMGYSKLSIEKKDNIKAEIVEYKKHRA